VEATFRTKGVELRNRGAYHLKSKKDFDDWQQEADAWDGRAEEELKGLAKHEAAIFATIDRFDPELDVLKDGRYLSDALIGQSSGENWHARRVAMLAFRVRELKSISARYAASASL